MICMIERSRKFVYLVSTLIRESPNFMVIVLNLVQVTKETALGLDRNKKKFDIREEYFVNIAIYTAMISS